MVKKYKCQGIDLNGKCCRRKTNKRYTVHLESEIHRNFSSEFASTWLANVCLCDRCAKDLNLI